MTLLTCGGHLMAAPRLGIGGGLVIWVLANARASGLLGVSGIGGIHMFFRPSSNFCNLSCSSLASFNSCGSTFLIVLVKSFQALFSLGTFFLNTFGRCSHTALISDDPSAISAAFATSISRHANHWKSRGFVFSFNPPAKSGAAIIGKLDLGFSTGDGELLRDGICDGGSDGFTSIPHALAMRSTQVSVWCTSCSVSHTCGGDVGGVKFSSSGTALDRIESLIDNSAMLSLKVLTNNYKQDSNLTHSPTPTQALVNSLSQQNLSSGPPLPAIIFVRHLLWTRPVRKEASKPRHDRQVTLTWPKIFEQELSDVMGSTLSLLRESFPPKPKWTTNDIPDLTGKVMIVTGANTGIGKDTVKALLEHNAKVYLGARSQAKAKAAIEDLQQKTGKEAI
ncbi:hypothetical protein D9758_017650 [Tetrapyrgos nigripes]|uniref:Uncharacterized protein n=1 Tax=Tetrapyrgos nigripes TaxID=182062 RepID=A0A8H5FLB0_9AGAR|nr:hypothetical protein D9758_017650 [Tetrapyrgos nigripes]